METRPNNTNDRNMGDILQFNKQKRKLQQKTDHRRKIPKRESAKTLNTNRQPDIAKITTPRPIRETYVQYCEDGTKGGRYRPGYPKQNNKQNIAQTHIKLRQYITEKTPETQRYKKTQQKTAKQNQPRNHT